MTLETFGLVVALVGCCGMIVEFLLPLYKKPWFLVPVACGLMLGGVIVMAIGGVR